MATAASLNLLPGVLNEIVSNSKILVVGAGGIGCELIKNLVLTGFQNIDIVDLDTIDVSNLNRQFLFQKQHVGKSKAKVARESVLKIHPSANIKAHHASITSPDYGPEYFKQFSVVLNALDNRAARSHVNRMCLASDIPLVESGSAGYYGQVTVIKKGLTECYECQPKPPQKTFPGCTIRNTPSEPIHCIVWAKHLFNQLFGEDDPDEDVSPDTADPEATGDAGAAALINNANDAGNIERISTHAWAVSCDYDANKLLHKLFHSDIKYLLSMDRLWINRRPPTPIDFENLPDAVAGPSWSDNAESGIQDQRIWSVKECAEVFKQSVLTLKERLHELVLEKKDEPVFLVWDKDDDSSMDFVTACANIRAYIFGISQKSRFDVKSMAGNIIPAIATTNAIIAGLIVMETLKVLQAKYDLCRTFYLNRKPNVKNRLIVPSFLDKPNPKCVVCSPKPEIALKVNVDSFTIANLENKVLKSNLNMVAPDVMEEGKGKVLISSEEGETAENNNKNLSELGVRNGTRLVCDDFLQTYQLIVTIIHCETLSEGQEFEVVGDITQLKATQSENGSSTSAQLNDMNEVEKRSLQVDEDDDLMIVESCIEIEVDTKKRGPEDLHILSSAKKQRLE